MSRPRALALAILAIVVHPQDSVAATLCDPNYAACYDANTLPMFWYTATLNAGTEYRFYTTGLTGTFADTIAYVLNETTKEVSARNDDGDASCWTATPAVSFPSGFGSCIRYTATTTHNGLFAMFAYIANYNGFADVVIQSRVPPSTSFTDVATFSSYRFGGWSKWGAVQQGDVLFAGVAPAAPASHSLYANRILLLNDHGTTSCTAPNCGTYNRGTSVAAVRRVDVTQNDSYARVIVGAAPNAQNYVSARLFHSRLGAGWGGGTPYVDRDGDGLSWEIEALVSGTDLSLNVNTCDCGNGVTCPSGMTAGPSTDCAGGINFAGRGLDPTANPPDTTSDWNPRDTDNDSLEDGHELFAVRRNCPRTPVAPYFDAGNGTDSTWGSPSGYIAELPLSALDPDPREHDSYFHMDVQGSGWPTAASLARISWVYEAEGLECEQSTLPCTSPAGTRNRIKLHLHQGLTVPPELYFSGNYGTLVERDHFNATFPSSRKDTGVFRHGQFMAQLGSGFSVSRSLVAYGSNATTDDFRVSSVFAHEAGHSIALIHGGADNDGSKANYASLMGSYGAPARKQASGTLFPATFGAACTTNANCPGGVCAAAGFCDLECSNEWARFSRGSHPTIAEAAVSESISSAWAGTLRCYDNGQTNPSPDQWNPLCTGSSCWADFDADMVLDASPVQASLNNNSTKTETLRNYDDWAMMHHRAGNQLDTAYLVQRYKSTFRVFESDMSAVPPADKSAWANAVSTSSGALVPASVAAPGGAGTIPFGNVIDFDGCTGSGCEWVEVTDSPASDSMSTTIDGKAPSGFRFDVMVYFDSLATAPQYIASNNLFRIETAVVAGKTQFKASVNRGPSWTSLTASNYSDPNVPTQGLLPGRWYQVVLAWDFESETARLYVAPWSSTQTRWEYAAGRCVGAVGVSLVSESDPGALRLGARAGYSTGGLTGALDQAFLMTARIDGLSNSDTNIDMCRFTNISNFDVMAEVTCDNIGDPIRICTK